MRHVLKPLILLVLLPYGAAAISPEAGLTPKQAQMMQASTLKSCLEGAKTDPFFTVESQIRKTDVAKIYCDCVAAGTSQMITKEDMEHLMHHGQMGARLHIAFKQHSAECMEQTKAQVRQ